MTDRRRRIRPARRPARPSPLAAGPRAAGFTLVELLVVMVIISILLAFIVRAAFDSVQRGQERATQALITKLDQGLNDRLSALLQTRPDPNTAHSYLAQIYTSSSTTPLAGNQRAQVIAWYDYIRREMPDTFYIQNATPSTTKGVYPLNFAGSPYPFSGGSPTDGNNLGQYILPLGNSVAPPYGDGSGGAGYYSPKSTGGLMELNPMGEGIFGASYPVAAGIYKNLGYLPQGYDGMDNDGNGTVDDSKEGLQTNPQVPSPDDPNTQIQLSALIAARLANHRHITARAEMLYALLVEGRGPLGSVFNADDFTDKEVQDTDNDGLPEFVDAWGNPLQFFRWPILYHSDLQRGQVITSAGAGVWNLSTPYVSMFEQREQDPLDLNQQLVAPAWWSNTYNNNATSVFAGYPSKSGGVGASGCVQAFEFYFHRLTEPTSGAGGAAYWDRGSTYGNRRAYYSKFLVLSAGPDRIPGVFIYSDTNLAALPRISWALNANESVAMPFSPTDPTVTSPIADFTQSDTFNYTSIELSNSYPPANKSPYSSPTGDPTNPSTYDLLQAAQDDISNQNIQTTVGIGGGQ